MGFASSDPDDKAENIPEKSYPFVGLCKDGRYRLYMPDLSLFAEADTLEEAHRLLDREKQTVLEKYATHGIEHLIPHPGQSNRANELSTAGASTSSKSRLSSLKRFCAKVTLAMLIVGGSLFIATSLLMDSLQSRLPQLARAVSSAAVGAAKERMAVDPGAYIARKIGSAAVRAEELSEDRRRELLSQARIIATAIAPFVQEFRSALGDFCTPQRMQASPQNSPSKQ